MDLQHILDLIKSDNKSDLVKYFNGMDEYESGLAKKMKKTLVLECLRYEANECLKYLNSGEVLSPGQIEYCLKNFPNNRHIGKYICGTFIHNCYDTIETIVKSNDISLFMMFEAAIYYYEPEKIYTIAKLHTPPENTEMLTYIEKKLEECNAISVTKL